MYLLVSSKSAIFPSQKSPSLTRVKKWCQHMPPQFRSNRSVAPKLLLIITANVQIYLNLPIRRCIESIFCPWAKVINISVFPSASTFPVAPLPPLLLKNTSDLPPPSQPPMVSRTQVQESLSWQWHPSPRFQRYVSFLHPQHFLFIPLLISLVASSYLRPFLPES